MPTIITKIKGIINKIWDSVYLLKGGKYDHREVHRGFQSYLEYIFCMPHTRLIEVF
jgi:hypothetical protein